MFKLHLLTPIIVHLSPDINFDDDIHDNDHSRVLLDDDYSGVLLTPATTVADSRDVPKRLVEFKSSILCPGKTFIIRDTNSGHVLALFDGKICLLPVDTLGSSFHWECHETDRWFGFKNLASGQYLSYHTGKYLLTELQHLSLEYFCLRMVRKGGYVMLMQELEEKKLWPVQAKDDQGMQRLAWSDVPIDQGLAWASV